LSFVKARFTLLVATLAVAACSSGSNPVTPTPMPPPVAQNPPPGSPPAMPPPAGPPTISITSTGVSPKDITIAVGSRVLFVNADVRSHELWGGPDHNQRDCPEVDVAGFLVAGQSRETGTFTRAQTCHFHDHTNYGNPAFEGRILVQ
jgi:hypothetical protein